MPSSTFNTRADWTRVRSKRPITAHGALATRDNRSGNALAAEGKPTEAIRCYQSASRWSRSMPTCTVIWAICCKRKEVWTKPRFTFGEPWH